MATLKITRLSQKPNARGNYSYKIIEGTPDLTHPDSTQPAQLYGRGELENKIIYHRSKFGAIGEVLVINQWTRNYQGRAQIAWTVEDIELEEIKVKANRMKVHAKAGYEVDMKIDAKALAEIDILEVEKQIKLAQLRNSIQANPSQPQVSTPAPTPNDEDLPTDEEETTDEGIVEAAAGEEAATEKVVTEE